MLHIGPNAPNESTAAYRHKQGVKRWNLPQQFNRDGALAGHNLFVVIG